LPDVDVGKLRLRGLELLLRLAQRGGLVDGLQREEDPHRLRSGRRA
jgi:hypothetical protein